MRKYGYTERRILGFYDLRSLCIKENYCTSATNEEYMELLKMADKENITTDDIVEIATMICEHTPELDICNKDCFCNVMFVIGNACTTVFDEQ